MTKYWGMCRPHNGRFLFALHTPDGTLQARSTECRIVVGSLMSSLLSPTSTQGHATLAERPLLAAPSACRMTGSGWASRTAARSSCGAAPGAAPTSVAGRSSRVADGITIVVRAGAVVRRAFALTGGTGGKQHGLLRVEQEP